MSLPKTLVSREWSDLNTINKFDVGISDSRSVIPTNEHVSKALKSLFVESLIDHFCKLLEKDPAKRYKLYEGMCRKLYSMQLIENTYHVEELASLRSYYQQALFDLMIDTETRLCPIPCLEFGCSRYSNEYEEICFLAAGGFGKVFKAKNRLDQAVYAIKKITLKCQNITTFGKKLNEVKTLAKLNHPNIVQYKSAWLEPLFNATTAAVSPDITSLSCNDSDLIVFQNNSSSSSSNSQLMYQENEKNMALCKYYEGIQDSVPQISALLYVSMQLCDKTLFEWLQKRNLGKKSINLPLALYVMMEATVGVQYIHSCNIVHHDIKPRNIFLSNDLRSVQVGDFGLSCCLKGHDHSCCQLEGGKFGTPLYAAPEQLKGLCDFKSDMFSLGLVFIELLTVFSTEMERVKVLTKARAGHIPSSIPLNWRCVIKDMLSQTPNKRPTAIQLIGKLRKLKAELCESEIQPVLLNEFKNHNSITQKPCSENLEISTFEKDEIIRVKNKEITQLREMLAQKECEITRLKNLINEYSLNK